MDFESFVALLSPRGQHVLEAAGALHPTEKDYLAHWQTLTRSYPDNLVQAALETAILRREAQEKFSLAGSMYFTRPALEQASSLEVSRQRATRYAEFHHVIDLGCSIGGDTITLAEKSQVLGIDWDSLRLAMAQANLAAWGLGFKADFSRADLNQPLPLSPKLGETTGLFFDPARRSGSRRLFSVQDYLPPLSIIKDWMHVFPALGVKISPGVRLDELRGYPAEVEFVSLRGDLKEAVLWFGPLKTAARRATILPGGFTLAEADQPRVNITPPRAWFYEPDPAILRAGQVAALAAQLGASQVDEEIAYLSTDSLQVTPFARVWQVEAWFPFQLKNLRAYLRQRGVGEVVIKKRGSPIVPEALIRQLKLNGDQHRTVFLTHLIGRPICVVCFPETRSARS